MIKKIIILSFSLFFIFSVETKAQDKTITIAGKVISRGMYIDMQGRPNPTLKIEDSAIVFKFTTEEALKYGLIKDGVLVDTSNWKVEIVYEKSKTNNDPTPVIKLFRRID